MRKKTNKKKDIPMEKIAFSFQEAVHDLNVFFHKNYGIPDAVVKIGLRPEAFERAVMEYIQMNLYVSHMSKYGEFFVEGVQILNRLPDKF